jgi:hypothetical protein
LVSFPAGLKELPKSFWIDISVANCRRERAGEEESIVIVPAQVSAVTFTLQLLVIADRKMSRFRLFFSINSFFRLYPQGLAKLKARSEASRQNISNFIF